MDWPDGNTTRTELPESSENEQPCASESRKNRCHAETQEKCPRVRHGSRCWREWRFYTICRLSIGEASDAGVTIPDEEITTFHVAAEINVAGDKCLNHYEIDGIY